MNVIPPGIATRPADPQPFKLRIEDYELLDRAGTFHGQRVELIGGRIIAVNAQYRPHAVAKNRLGRRLQSALEAMHSSLEVIVEATLALSPYDLPDPDILIGVVAPHRDYFRVPEISFVIEVADSSLRQDLGEKRDLYARSGVAEYWVVDINARQVHQFWAPAGAAFAESRTLPLDGALASATIPDLAIDGSGIL